MLQQDYLMKMLMDFIMGIISSIEKEEKERRPDLAAHTLENSIGNAVDMDSSFFLALSPESMVSMLQISSIDERMAEYITRSLALASTYCYEAGNEQMGALRAAQAEAVAQAYGYDISGIPYGADSTAQDAIAEMERFVEQERAQLDHA